MLGSRITIQITSYRVVDVHGPVDLSELGEILDQILLGNCPSEVPDPECAGTEKCFNCELGESNLYELFIDVMSRVL